MSFLSQRLPAEPDLIADALKLAMDSLVKTASQGWYIATSDIAGKGVFAAKDYAKGDSIGLAMTQGDKDEFDSQCWNITALARYCNHQQNSNVEVRKEGDRFDLVATRPIEEDEELVSDYRQVTRAVGPRSRMQWDGEDVPSTDFEDYVER
jgi:hypothetical protein